MQSIELPRLHKALTPFDGDFGMAEFLGLAKADASGRLTFSRQGEQVGEVEHPTDFTNAILLRSWNPYHSTCIDAKVASSVGIGFLTDHDRLERRAKQGNLKALEQLANEEPIMAPSKEAKALDPLCVGTFQEVLNDMGEDFEQTGNGYMEVTREEGGKIGGIYHMAAPDVKVFVEDEDGRNWHFVTLPADGGEMRHYARYGDLDDFLERATREDAPFSLTPDEDGKIYASELIHFRQPTSMSKWYGAAKWLAAVPAMEHFSCVIQKEFDFFLNRCVPELLLFLLGRKMDPADWKELESKLKNHIGAGNAHKTAAFNIQDPEMQVQVHKLAAENRNNEGLGIYIDPLAAMIVSAHGVPPLLAGIHIPGKLSANNELPNALQAFQLLSRGQVQRLHTQKLRCTLGAEDGVEGLDENDFEFKTLLDEMDVGTMDTVSRMREPLAAAQDRDPADGLKE